MSTTDTRAEAEQAWQLRIEGIHGDNRITPFGVVGVIQPIVVIDPPDDMTVEAEIADWEVFTAACGRDGATGERLLQVRPTRSDAGDATIDLRHITATHSFTVPAGDMAAFEKLAELATIPVVYRFRHRPELMYRGIVVGASGEADVSGDGPELWISRFGRGSRPNPHVNALEPVSLNLVADTSPADVFMLDLTRFMLPASENCVMCAQPLGAEETNREHVVSDWLRALSAYELGIQVDGVVAAAHASCNASQSEFEDHVRQLTLRRLAGEELSDEELGAVGYWMVGRMTLLDRAAGIEIPKAPPLDDSFQSANIVLPPLYSGRLGNDEHPAFRTLVLGPWIYHCCWTEDGCGVPPAEVD